MKGDGTKMKRKAFTVIEFAIALAIVGILISIAIPVWVKMTRDLHIARLLDTAAQGVLYVLSDARALSVRPGTYVSRVSLLTDESGTPTHFAAGVRIREGEGEGVTNKFYALSKWEIPQAVIQMPFRPYVYDSISIDFEPDGKYSYIFGAWVKEESGKNGSYELLTGEESTTILIYLTKRGTGTDAPQRVIKVVDGMPSVIQ